MLQGCNKLTRRLTQLVVPMKKLAIVGALALTTVGAFAQSDVGTIVSSASTTFGAVATLCVTIGTFLIGYRLARKVR